MKLPTTTSRELRLARILLRMPVAAGLGAFFLAVSTFAAPPPKDVTLDEPIAVEVEGVVEVLGAVDVLSEPKKDRYLQAHLISIPSDESSEGVTFSIPERKLLVVETVTVLGYAPVGANVFGWLNVSAKTEGAPSGIVPLPTTYQGLFDGESHFMLTQPVLLRIDSSENEIRAVMQRTSTGGGSSFTVTIFGYLEDL